MLSFVFFVRSHRGEGTGGRRLLYTHYFDTITIGHPLPIDLLAFGFCAKQTTHSATPKTLEALETRKKKASSIPRHSGDETFTSCFGTPSISGAECPSAGAPTEGQTDSTVESPATAIERTKQLPQQQCESSSKTEMSGEGGTTSSTIFHGASSTMRQAGNSHY